jgi:arsenate reductase
MAESPKVSILFLCTGNSCRSQMAEGYLRHLKGKQVNAYSAGIETHGLNPKAVQVMKEVGIDILSQESQHINEYIDTKIDYVITVCSAAAETCPHFPGTAKIIHKGFDDPPSLAKKAKTEKEALDIYRRVRDEIRDYIKTLPEALMQSV